MKSCKHMENFLMLKLTLGVLFWTLNCCLLDIGAGFVGGEVCLFPIVYVTAM